MTRPLPMPTPLTAGFWAAAREHRLVIQRCGRCGRFRHYPQPLCPQCTSPEWTWEEAAGTGTVHTYTRSHLAFRSGLTPPYVVATIQLPEGVRLISDLPPEDEVGIGAAVEVFFEDLGEITLPRFRMVRR